MSKAAIAIEYLGAIIVEPRKQYLSADVKAKYPALTRKFIEAEAETDDQLLKDYQMIQYDILNGRRWSDDNEFYQTK